jgi:SAM-dependent methyltransferase
MVMTETAKYRHLTRLYCYRSDGEPGCGIDLASQGDPVVPWAWQLDLSPDQFNHYNNGHPPAGPINLYGDAFRKFVEDGSLDFLYSSHLLEDAPCEEWPDILRLWKTALKPGGTLIILVPERDLWAAAIEKGQPPNCAHCCEPKVGDLSKVAESVGLVVVEERLTNCHEGDYSILFVAKRPLKA